MTQPASAAMIGQTLWPVAEIRHSYAALQSAPREDKGTALEQFCCVFFDALPGVRVAERRAVDDMDSQEVDIVLDNDRHPSGLFTLDPILFVEAKNWSRRVGSAEVAWFDWKVRLSGYKQAFLVVANGVTGRADDRNAAWSILRQANMEGRRLLVLSPKEMAGCANPPQVQQLIQSKLRALAVGRHTLEV